MADINSYSPHSGIMIGADGRAYNLVDLYGGGTPINDQFYDIHQYPPLGSIVIGSDGRAYDLAQIIREKAVSAYEVAHKNGFTGTQAEWLATLNGSNGASAFEMAVAGGYTGTQAEWLASLRGTDGQSAFALAVAGGYSGTQAEWLASLRGADGKSAFDVAAAGGYSGTQAEWLASLRGADGKSAFDVAVAGGYSGTQAEWLASLRGTDGQSAFALAVAGGYSGTQSEWLASLHGANGVGLPAGGTTGQVLRKKSDADYDFEYGQATSAGLTLLWTNPNPTAAMGGVTLVTYAANAYKAIGVIIRQSTGNASQSPLFIIPIGQSSICQFGAKEQFHGRHFSASATAFTCGGGFYYIGPWSGGSAAIGDDTYHGIPVAIYGMN